MKMAKKTKKKIHSCIRTFLRSTAASDSIRNHRLISVVADLIHGPVKMDCGTPLFKWASIIFSTSSNFTKSTSVWFLGKQRKNHENIVHDTLALDSGVGAVRL